MRNAKIAIFGALLLMLAVGKFGLAPARAGERLLTVNGNTENEVWFIKDEKSLIMNGFDLTPQQILLPAWLDKVTITVDTPVPDQMSTVVVYEDANGGSPVDAKLVGQQDVNITSVGSVTITLNKPVTITAPVVWVGFYLPVGFRFLADTSGSSVLTYWGWTPGGTFDVANLGSAQVFGPSDGSAPVGLDLKGKARITAEITGANPLLGTPVVMQGYQTQGNNDVNMGVMVDYPDCRRLKHDTADEYDSARDAFDIFCRVVDDWNAPPSPAGFLRKGRLYDVWLFTDNGIQANVFPVAVTHCIDPDDADVNSGVIGVAYGAPRVWRILPTQGINKLLCAEIPHGGNISYFAPQTSSGSAASPP